MEKGPYVKKPNSTVQTKNEKSRKLTIFIAYLDCYMRALHSLKRFLRQDFLLSYVSSDFFMKIR